MVNGHFYFIEDVFYNSLPNCGLMTNKGTNGRPCHYCFEYDNYYWMIPISSQIDKYRSIYNHKITKYGRCDGIRFGYVNGEERAFLIQNCFPVTEKYVKNEYRINNNTTPVTISKKLSKELNRLLRKIIRLYKNGKNIPFTNLDEIISYLSRP